MEFLTELDRQTLREIAQLAFCNPFQSRWLSHESTIFKLRELAVPPLPSSEGDLARPRGEHPSFRAVDDWLQQKLGQLCAWLQHHRRVKVPAEDRQLFVDVAGYLLYRSVRHAVDRLIGDEEKPPEAPQVAQTWEEFRRHYEPLSSVYQLRGGTTDPAHLFACFFQVRPRFTTSRTTSLDSPARRVCCGRRRGSRSSPVTCGDTSFRCMAASTMRRR